MGVTDFTPLNNENLLGNKSAPWPKMVNIYLYMYIFKYKINTTRIRLIAIVLYYLSSVASS